MATEKKLFMPVSNLKLTDLLDWQNADQREHRLSVQETVKIKDLQALSESTTIAAYGHKKCFGNKVKLNDELIALFRLGNDVFASQAECPHAGGPLYLADIEDLQPGQVCLKCPWHKWTFDIVTGCSVTPEGQNLSAKTYPTKVDKDGKIFIGFDSLGSSFFMTDIDSL